MTQPNIPLDPVLFVGGAGSVGTHAVQALRRLQPSLPIAIGGRDLAKAQRLADQVGNAEGVRVDAGQTDLGLPADRRFSAVVALLKDDALNTMQYAQRHQLPYIAFADFVFDTGPGVARFIHRPQQSPVLMLGQYLGGTAALAVLHFARAYRQLDSIAIAGVMDEDDMGGPAAQADFERLNHAPRPLILKDGKFVWTQGDALKRGFIDATGVQRTGDALPLLDVASLAAATDASDIRVDLAFRPRGATRSNEVIIELAGRRHDGTPGRSRHELIDPNVYSAQSGRGAALAVERMLGLAGGPALPPGLYQPEGLLDPAYVMEKIQAFGTEVRTVV